MLNLTYVGIAFSLVFYVVFGLAVHFMELTDKVRNRARLFILITSMIIFAVSDALAGVLNILSGRPIYGALFLVLFFASVVIVFSIFVELHQINVRIRMRRFMVLFGIVDRFITEGRTREEILDYLTRIQKLTVKEATDFMDFISDPGNHQFLAEVNEKIQEAKVSQQAEQDYLR